VEQLVGYSVMTRVDILCSVSSSC